MEKVVSIGDRVRQILESEFPPPDQVRIDEDDGIIAVVVSPRFRDLDSMDRQDLVRPALKKHLTKAERQEIVIVVTATPEEDAVYSRPYID